MFAQRVAHLEMAGLGNFFELAAQVENPINLSIGQAHYDVPQPAKEAAVKAIMDGINGYTVPQGIGELNERVTNYVKEQHGVASEASLITSGASGGLLLSFLTLLDQGDEILLPGNAFSRREDHFRISFATDDDMLQKGIEILNELV